MTALRPLPNPDRAVRIAVAGKGGCGKTATVALLARELARRGTNVLAVDLDTSPGLTLSLGLPPDAGRLPESAVEERDDTTYGYGLRSDLTPALAVERHAAVASERIRLLGFGDVDRASNTVARQVDAVTAIFDGFDEAGWVVIGDLEPGPARAFEGFARHADLCLVLAEGTRASCWSAQRICSVLDHDEVRAGLLVSQARSEEDERTVRRLLPDRDVTGTVPYDPAVQAAEVTGSLMELAPGSPAVVAVRRLADRLSIEEEVVAS